MPSSIQILAFAASSSSRVDSTPAMTFRSSRLVRSSITRSPGPAGSQSGRSKSSILYSSYRSPSMPTLSHRNASRSSRPIGSVAQPPTREPSLYLPMLPTYTRRSYQLAMIHFLSPAGAAGAEPAPVPPRMGQSSSRRKARTGHDVYRKTDRHIRICLSAYRPPRVVGRAPP